MGVAVAAVVNSLVTDPVMPLLAMVIGKPDFGNPTCTINGTVFRYGLFLTAVVTFLSAPPPPSCSSSSR